MTEDVCDTSSVVDDDGDIERVVSYALLDVRPTLP